MTIVEPGHAYWEQRHILREMRPRIEALSAAIDFKSDFSLFQWAQITSLLLSFKPDRIIELGRNTGNSTTAFVEAAHYLRAGGNNCDVVSLCMSTAWEDRTVPQLSKICSSKWFMPLTAIRDDILRQDYDKLLGDSQRTVLFWDAHGFEVAGCVLGEILPKLASRRHIVIMHDLSDQRYLGDALKGYGGHPIWSGTSAGDSRLILGNINSAVAQAISISDFATRNELPLDSGDHSIRQFIGTDPAKVNQMQELLGPDFFSLNAHWFWFTLNDHPKPILFPSFRRPE